MYIYNKKNSVKIVVDELPDYANKEFRIFPISSKGCVGDKAIYVGSLDSEGRAEMNLPDGMYLFSTDFISYSGDDITTTIGDILDKDQLSQAFKVYYNFLPELIRILKDSFCRENCNNCKGEYTEETILKDYFRISLYLNCSGLLLDLPAVRKAICDQNEILSSACQFQNYYGRFNYSYVKSIKKIFSYLFASLYKYTLYNIRDEDINFSDFENMFEYSAIKRCLYNSDIVLDDLFCDINKLNCSCDE